MNDQDSTAHPVTLALDAEGGDLGPAEIIAGGRLAASQTLKVLLIGRPDVVQPHLGSTSHMEFMPAGSVIDSHEEPATAVKSKPDSSIAVGARAVAEGRAQGFVSAGSTGAMLAAGLLLVKRVRGIRRPAIITTLPAAGGPVLFLDAGATSDCRPEHLVEYGVLGTAYARTVLGLRDPRVALLNIGEEEGKGSDLAREAYRRLNQSGLNFVGNIEGRDLLFNTADVVVTDGFTGNVALKVLEGCASAIFTRVRSVASSGVRTRVGGALLRPALRELRDVMDPEAYGGTYLLGVQGLVVICHGNATRRGIANALHFAADALRKGILEGVEREVAAIIDVPDSPDS